MRYLSDSIQIQQRDALLGLALLLLSLGLAAR